MVLVRGSGLDLGLEVAPVVVVLQLADVAAAAGLSLGGTIVVVTARVVVVIVAIRWLIPTTGVRWRWCRCLGKYSGHSGRGFVVLTGSIVPEMK